MCQRRTAIVRERPEDEVGRRANNIVNSTKWAINICTASITSDDIVVSGEGDGECPEAGNSASTQGTIVGDRRIGKYEFVGPLASVENATTGAWNCCTVCADRAIAQHHGATADHCAIIVDPAAESTAIPGQRALANCQCALRVIVYPTAKAATAVAEAGISADCAIAQY